MLKIKVMINKSLGHPMPSQAPATRQPRPTELPQLVFSRETSNQLMVPSPMKTGRSTSAMRCWTFLQRERILWRWHCSGNSLVVQKTLGAAHLDVVCVIHGCVLLPKHTPTYRNGGPRTNIPCCEAIPKPWLLGSTRCSSWDVNIYPYLSIHLEFLTQLARVCLHKSGSSSSSTATPTPQDPMGSVTTSSTKVKKTDLHATSIPLIKIINLGDFTTGEPT